MPNVRSALGAFASLGSATVVGQVIGFLALAFVARRVGPANLGDYNFAASVVTAFGLGTIGVGVLAIREIAVDVDHRRAVAAETTMILAAMNGVALVAVVAAAPLIAPSPLSVRLLRILALTFLTSAFVADWALMGLGRFRWVSVGRLAGQVVYALLVFALLRRGSDGVVDYAIFNLVGYAVISAILLAVYLAVAGYARPAPGLARRLRARLRRSLPIGFPLVVLQLYLTVDLILLGYVGSAQETGQYAVASKLPIALTTLGMVWGSVLYPHVARADDSELADITRDLGRATTFTLCAGAVLVSGAAAFAVALMTTLFGHAYRPAAPSFALLAAAAILLLVDITLGNTLLGRGRERQYAVAVSIGVLVNVILDLILIPPAGAVGAAAATLAVEIGVLIFFVGRVSRYVGRIPIDWSLVGRCLLASAGAAALVLAADPGSLPVRIGLFLAGALVAALVTGLARRSVWLAAWNRPA